MIRSALIALGLSASGLGAGSLAAQGMVPTAPIVASCGGLRIGLGTAGDPDQDTLDQAADVVSRRVGGRLSAVFDYADVTSDGIVVSVPQALIAAQGDPVDAIAPLLERIEFAFMDVIGPAQSADAAAGPDQIILDDAELPDVAYILDSTPVLTGTDVIGAASITDQFGRPAISFTLSAAGSGVFADYTAANIGRPFAIVLRGKVMSAPTIQSVIDGPQGMITGAFTQDDTVALAAILQGGVLPFDMDVTFRETLDGSDPSADFCP